MPNWKRSKSQKFGGREIPESVPTLNQSVPPSPPGGGGGGGVPMGGDLGSNGRGLGLQWARVGAPMGKVMAPMGGGKGSNGRG